MHPLGRQQLLHAAEHAAWGGHLEEIDVVEQALGVQCHAYRRMGGHHVGLTGEHHAVGVGGEGQLFRTDAVQGQEYALFGDVQDRQAEITVDMPGGVLAVLAPESKQGLGRGNVLLRQQGPATEGGHQVALPGHGEAAGQTHAHVGQRVGWSSDATGGKQFLQGHGSIMATVPQLACEAVHYDSNLTVWVGSAGFWGSRRHPGGCPRMRVQTPSDGSCPPPAREPPADR